MFVVPAEYASTVKEKVVVAPCSNNSSVGWSATLPVICPLLERTRFGGSTVLFINL